MQYTSYAYIVVRLVFVAAIGLFGAACGGDAPRQTPEQLVEADARSRAGIQVLKPPVDAVAGDTVSASFQLVDHNGQPIASEGVAVSVIINQHQFADGSSKKSSVTDAEGIAHIDVVIERAARGYDLLATGFYARETTPPTITAPFEILAAEASFETSTIRGANGVTNDARGADITVHCRDVYGNPVAGVAPEFEASGEGNAYGACTESDQDGVSTCTMMSTRAGLKTLSLTAPFRVEGAELEFRWNCDENAAPFGAGVGDPDDPYRLCTDEQLNAIGDDSVYVTKDFFVTRDIDMQDVSNVEMIGSEDHPFTGYFDGNHAHISHLHIDDETTQSVGLFRVIGAPGRVEALTLDAVDIRGLQWVGGLVGENTGTVVDVSVNGSVHAEGSVAGGLVGYNAKGGEILAGRADGNVQGARWVGGLIGYNNGRIRSSSAAARTQGSSRYVGGLVGLNNADGVIAASYASGYVHGDAHYMGGLTGVNSGLIRMSYATGRVHGTDWVGGLVGQNGREQKAGLIQQAYAAGPVQGQTHVGGLVGENQPGATVHSYWDIETSGLSSSDGGAGLSTNAFANVMNGSHFYSANWDFVDTWVIGTAADGETRPVLKWQTP